MITFSAGTGGTLTGSATPTVSGGKVAVGDIPTATRSGYKFLGWSGGTLTNATAAQVAAVTHSADTTYTAQWEQQYRVTYNSNLPAGASVSNMPTSPSAYLDKGSNYTLVGTPSCSGATDGHAYKFKGWGATANATTTITAINNISKDETVYAIWEALPQVTFKIGTGGKFSDNTTADKKVNANASGAVTAPAVTANTGYSFKGWSDGTNTLTEAQVNAKNHTADTTYTAQWELRKVTSGTPDANNNLVEGSTISLEKVTLSDGTDIAKASYASSDLANFEWYIVNSGVTPVPGTHTPVQSNDKTGNYLIPTGTAPTQHVWVLVKGGGTNISDEPCLIDMGPVGVESFTYEVEIHVSGSKPATVPNGLTASLSTTNLEAGKSYGVTASVGGNSANKYKFSGWSDSLTSGSSFNPAAGSVSVYSVPATTTGTGLVSKPGKNYIYANFVPIPHLTLTNSGGATGAQAFKGQLGNDGKDSARNVTYTFPAGSKFTASTTPGATVAVGAGTAGNLVIECTETAPGTYTDTLTITYEDADGVKYTLTQPVAYTVTVPTKTVHVEVAVDGGSASDTLPANTTVSPTKANPVTLEGGDSTLLSTNTSNRGYRFTGWSAVAAANGSLSTTAAATNNGGTTTFIMADPVPSTDVTVVANYITVPWLEAGSKIPGGHATGTSPTVKPATVEINNTGAANATAVKVSVDDSRFELATGGMTATGNTVAAGGP
ncbi:InlB B-repeat-containing protein, partial [Vermiculatibacterium agrestimuris]|uniref:InlB B-repeat-containing protein n=1 Tax=Vermiculatibacterium agrestimuris TaxID=2941519 RepID=UPI00203F8947